MTSLLGPESSRPLCQEVLQRIQWSESQETVEHSSNSYFAVRNSASRLNVNVSSPHSSNTMEIEPNNSTFSSPQPLESQNQAESTVPIDFCSLNLVFVPQDGTNETERVGLCFEIDDRRTTIGWSCPSCLEGRTASSCGCIAAVGLAGRVKRSSEWAANVDRDPVPVRRGDD